MANSDKETNWLFVGFITFAIVIAIVVAYFASTYLFLAVYKIKAPLNPFLLFEYYSAYADMPNTPKKFNTALKLFTFAPIVIVLGGALFIWLAQNKKQSLHGEARFATLKEIIKDGLIKKYSSKDKTDAAELQKKIDEENKNLKRDTGLKKGYKGFVLPPKSLLLGKFNGKFLTFEGFQFAFLSAPTRSGKGVGIVIPNLLSYPESMVVLDIKYENYDITSGFRERCLGQSVYRFSPFDENGATHRYNPLSYVSSGAKRITDIDAIGAALYRPSPGEKDPFWKDNAKKLFRGMALMVLENPEFDTTIGQIARLSTGMGHPDGFKGFILERLEKGFLNDNNELQKYSLVCSQTLQAIMQMPDATFGGVVTSFTTPLGAWDNPYVDNATSADDFDLRDVRKRGMTIYVGVQPKYLSQASTILNIFFDQLISENTAKLPKEDPSLTHQCVLLMDEFTALGRVQSMSDAIGFMAGYNMRPFIIIQNREQLEDCYGKEQAKTMLSNFATMVMYPPSALNTEEAQKCSEMLGYMTFKSESKGKSNPSGFGNGSSSQSTNISDQRRALMLPQEILEMKPTEEIVKVNNSKPIFAEKIRYYLDKDFTCRANLPRTEVNSLDVPSFMAKIEEKTNYIKNEKKTFLNEDVTNFIEQQKQLLQQQKEAAANADSSVEEQQAPPDAEQDQVIVASTDTQENQTSQEEIQEQINDLQNATNLDPSDEPFADDSIFDLEASFASMGDPNSEHNQKPVSLASADEQSTCKSTEEELEAITNEQQSSDVDNNTDQTTVSDTNTDFDVQTSNNQNTLSTSSDHDVDNEQQLLKHAETIADLQNRKE